MSGKDIQKTALRLPRDLHSAIVIAAEVNGRSMNAEITDRLQSTLGTILCVSINPKCIDDCADFLDIINEVKGVEEADPITFSEKECDVTEIGINIDAKFDAMEVIHKIAAYTGLEVLGVTKSKTFSYIKKHN